MNKLIALTVLGALCSCTQVKGHAPKVSAVDVLRQQESSVRTIAPIFSQLVTFSLPKGFVPTLEKTTKDGSYYIHESVLDGESVKKWSQMITVTGAKGLSSNPEVTPKRFAGSMAGVFKYDCPDSFSATNFGEIKIGSNDAFAAVLSCGIASSTEPYSESALLIVVKGENDYYTIQWAERGDASETPIKFDYDKWTVRIKKLAPIKLCPIVPGEPAPYPSCLNRT